MENKPMNGSVCFFKRAKNIYIPAMSVSDSGIEAPTEAPSFELSGHKLHPIQSLKAGDGAGLRHSGKPPLMPVAFHKTSGTWRQRYKQPASSSPSHSLHAEPHYGNSLF
ncbi:unnamed protein product [Lymnaea stagnalis]|uniref:Uncharacterized protein n=1 Tax=Lymnaea stagnalis TaxID=6523 RepID=A0AAV2HGY9_LYMST